MQRNSRPIGKAIGETAALSQEPEWTPRMAGLSGGGGSQQRTRLCVEFPDMQGINRQFLQNQALQTQSSARKRRQSQDFF
jgi:hypothetical protein